jgi:heptosyltransferase II
LACAFLGIDIAPPRAIDWRVAPADQTAADALIITRGLGARWVLLCPFAATAIKQQDKTWPAFAALAATLAARGMRLAACPGPGEEAALRARFPAVVSLEGVPMGVYAGLARRATLVVAGDTGPAHLAAAVGAPLLSVLGPTPPEQWAPWGPTVTVLRRWPDWPSADEVAAQVLAMAGAAAHG